MGVKGSVHGHIMSHPSGLGSFAVVAGCQLPVGFQGGQALKVATDVGAELFFSSFFVFFSRWFCVALKGVNVA